MVFVIFLFLFFINFGKSPVLAQWSCESMHLNDNCSPWGCYGQYCWRYCTYEPTGSRQYFSSGIKKCTCAGGDKTTCTHEGSGCTGTGPDVNTCCSKAGSWSIWGDSCSASTTCESGVCTRFGCSVGVNISCTVTWSKEKHICSIGDKCVSGDVHASGSTCDSVKGEYKACCTTDGVKHNCNGDDNDPSVFTSCQGKATLVDGTTCCKKINGQCGSLTNSIGLDLNASTPGLCINGNSVSNFRIEGSLSSINIGLPIIFPLYVWI